MAGIKISGLPAVVTPALTDIMPEVQPATLGITYKCTFQQLLTLYNANIQITEAQVTNLVADLAAKLSLTGGTMSGNINFGGFKGTNAADPSAAQDYATKNYVDQTSLNGTSVYAATTTNLTVTQSGAGVGATLTNAGAQAIFAIDGVSPPVGSNVLVKNLSNAAHEGIYTVTNVGSVSTNWILTRATSYDTATEINNTGLIVVQNGSTLAGTAWYNTSTIVTVDTTNFNYSSFGLTLPLAVVSGGTGATTAAGARTNLGAAASGANADITSMIGLTGVLQAPTAITSSAGLNLLSFTYTASAVNYLNITNNATGFYPAITATGSDTNIGMTLVAKGTGSIIFAGEAGSTNLAIFTSTPSAVNSFDFINNATGSNPAITATGSDTNITLQLTGKGTSGIYLSGVSTNSNAVPGQVGEFISNQILAASGITFAANTITDLTSISLTAGDWDVWGNIVFTALGATPSGVTGWINTVSATIPDLSLISEIRVTGTLGLNMGITVPMIRLLLPSTTTVYLTGDAVVASGNSTACGGIYARRRR